MEDDGIQLNFASPSSDAAGSRFNKKKQGGRWTDRLKANKAAKRRTEKPEDPAPAKAKITAPSTSQPAAKRPRPEQAASNPSHVRSVPSARPSSGKGDDFANVDIAALARRAASSSGNRSQPQHDSRHAQGIVSNLFTGPSAEQNDGRAEGVEDLDKMDRKLKLNASNAPLPTSGPSNSTSHKDDKSFEGLGLDPLLVGHLKNKMGIERPTRIQRVALKGLLDPTPLTSNTPPPQFSLVGDSPSVVRDAFIQSQTGSGKTLSYLLPIIQTLLPLASSKDVGYVDRSIGTLGIVLAPTRELARQIWGVTERILGLRLSIESGGGVLDDMAKTVEAKDGGVVQEDGEVEEIEVERRRPVYQRYLVTTLLTGGSTRTHEKSRLRKGCPILISTPGRLLDHLQNTASFKVDRLLWLVLDEADRLIEEGFGETLEGIMKAIEGRRRIGIEMDGQGLGRSKKKKFVPGKTIMKAPFDDEDEDEEEGDDDWDYELAGPRKNGGEHKEVSTQMNWPYWALGRRTILCSATVSGEVQKLAGTALRDPIMYRASDAGKIDEDEDEEDEPELKDLAQVGEGQGQVKMEEVVLKEEEEEEDIIEVDAGGKVEKFTPPSQLDQRYMVVPLKLRLVTMVALLRSLIAKMNTATSPSDQGMKVIVFMSCTDSVDFHWKLMGGVQMGAPPPKSEDDEDEDDDEATKAAKLKAKKLKAKKEQEPISYACPLLPSTSIMRLHGSLPLQTRRESLAAFSQASTAEAKHSILFCTSVASRGLDLPLVRAVIQYDLPTEQGIAEYVHRVGRTARVGKGGESWAFVENAEKDWVPWVQEGMSSNEKDAGQVQMRQVAVEDVLKRGFSPKGGSGYEREFEQRATQVQLAFERWVLENNQNATLARQAFSSYVRAYSTHPHEEKRFFHVKNLHLGHLAKCFGLRETPGKIGGGGAPTKKGKDGKGGKRKRGDDESEDEMDEEEMLAAASKGGKSSAAKTDTERRMYEAVRKQGRLTKVGGKLAAGGGDAEYQVATGGRDLEKMVKGRGAVRNRR